MSEGDIGSFELIYHQYRESLYRFTLKFVKSSELADDLTQEVFLQVWELREQMVKADNFGAYLFTMCRNHVLNFLKRAGREAVAMGEMLKHYQAEQPRADEGLLSAEYRQFIQQVLLSLPEQTRLVFKLCREEQKGYDEVAAQLGISRNAVKKHMVRSHKAFKERLGDDPAIPLGILLLLFLR